ncbi:hypothetical protein Cylst_3863 [Cylindrospermum stagnale PCC 7417]|uniref:Uncharacterized protein n=1 Tax=Cylindrospermum stagnale PCC 7417 TaxID=56107 RepID=K9X2N7_9NOST|nr:hypothetical protein Cylst_3863 [Cylindrospermum stagnale PCC 7417]
MSMSIAQPLNMSSYGVIFPDKICRLNLESCQFKAFVAGTTILLVKAELYKLAIAY